MNIIDWFAQKLTPKTVADRQTDSPQAALLHREFAGHPSKGITPARLAEILLLAEQGDLLAQAELFMDMEEKDAHIAAELGKRKMAVKKLDWSLVPPRNASKQEMDNTQKLEDLIRDELDIGMIRLDALNAIGHGYSCLELGWGRNSQGFWYPNQIEHRPPTWFTSPQEDRNTVHLRDNSSMYGVPLQPFGWIAHVHKSRSGYLARIGLHRALAWPYLFKNYSARDLAEFLEIYGLPIRIGKYPANAQKDEKTALMKALLSLGHHAAGIIPDSMQMELAQVSAQGNAEAFMAMINWCEASQSKVILGGTLTSSTGANGNRSLGDVHNEVRLDIRDDDATQLDQTLSLMLVYPMAMLNGWFADNRTPRFVSDTQEPDDLQLFADAIPKLVGIGVQVPAGYVNAKLKIPLPKDGEPVLAAAAAMPPGLPTNPNPTALAGLVASGMLGNVGLATGNAATTAQAPAVDNPQGDTDPTPVSAMAGQLATDADPIIQGWIAKIADKLATATDLSAFKADLLASYGDLDTEELAKVMGFAFAAADLAGRFDVIGEQE